MSRPNKNNAISNLVSGVAWSMKGEEISHWDINNVGIAQPTDEAINTELTKLQTDYNNNSYARKREVEYPNVKDFMEAYTEKEIGGDDTKWNEYKTKYNKVRTDNPKE